MWHRYPAGCLSTGQCFKQDSLVFFVLKLQVGWILPRWLHCSPVPFHFTASVPSVLEERSGFQAKAAAGGCQAGVLATGTQREHISLVPVPASSPASIPVRCWRLLGRFHDLSFTTWDQCPRCFGRCIHRERPAETKDLPVAGRFNKKICSFLFYFL